MFPMVRNRYPAAKQGLYLLSPERDSRGYILWIPRPVIVIVPGKKIVTPPRHKTHASWARTHSIRRYYTATNLTDYSAS